MEKIIKTAMGVGNTAMGVENTGTYPIRDAEKLASAINNLANAIDRLNEQPEEMLNSREAIKNLIKNTTGEDVEKLVSRAEEECLFVPNPKYIHHHFNNELLKKVLEDTPEEWEKRIDYFWDYGSGYILNIDNEWVEDESELIDFIKQLLEEREDKAREDECEKLIDVFDNLKYKEDNGDTDWVNKNFILGVLKDELSKLKDKEDEK